VDGERGGRHGPGELVQACMQVGQGAQERLRLKHHLVGQQRLINIGVLGMRDHFSCTTSPSALVECRSEPIVKPYVRETGLVSQLVRAGDACRAGHEHLLAVRQRTDVRVFNERHRTVLAQEYKDQASFLRHVVDLHLFDLVSDATAPAAEEKIQHLVQDAALQHRAVLGAWRLGHKEPAEVAREE